jgi:hypothetical protein
MAKIKYSHVKSAPVLHFIGRMALILFAKLFHPLVDNTLTNPSDAWIL